MAGARKAPMFLNLGWDAPSGQMYSTVNDLFKVANLLLK